MIAPLGSHRIRPEPTVWLMVNSSSCLPSTRWSRRLASSSCVEVGVEFLLVEERGGVEPLQLLRASASPFQYAPATESSLNALPMWPVLGMCRPRQRSMNSPWR